VDLNSLETFAQVFLQALQKNFLHSFARVIRPDVFDVDSCVALKRKRRRVMRGAVKFFDDE